MFARVKKTLYICTRFKTRSIYDGAIAQLVEQRTENPCVPGSIPGGTTEKAFQSILRGFFREICAHICAHFILDYILQ